MLELDSDRPHDPDRRTETGTEITSKQNALVKRLRQLHQAKGRREEGLCLLEGTHVVEAAIETHYPIAIACATRTWQARQPDLWAALVERADRVETVSEPVLGAIATTVQPDGVVVAAPRPRWLDSQNPGPPDFGRVNLLLSKIQDPGNLGTMIRAAAAAGCDRLWLSADSVDLDHPKVLRATAGQWFRLPMAVVADLPKFIAQAQAAGIPTIATTPAGGQIYWQADLSGPLLLLLGNEGAGLSEDLIARADRRVKIPLAAGVESLNVGITAALLLYESQRQAIGREPAG